MTSGTWFDDVSERLKMIGLSTAEQVAQAASSKVIQKVSGGSSQPGDSKKDPGVVQQNPWNIAATNGEGLSGVKLAGIGLPVLLIGGAAIYLLMRK